MALNEKGNQLYSGDKNGIILIINTVNNKILNKWKAHNEGINGLIIDEIKNQLYSSSHDKTIKLWCLKKLNSKPIKILTNYKSFFLHIHLTNKYLLASSEDQTIFMFKNDYKSEEPEKIIINRDPSSLTAS